jgi:hypothetical protein
MWWPVVIATAALLLTCCVAAAVLPSAPGRRRLRPLANTRRLTALPEYARAARLQSVSTIAVLVLLVALFATAVLAAARPQGPDEGFAAAHPEDVMLCVGQPVTDPSTGALLRSFAGQATTGAQTGRIGLTSVNLRVVPMTRDYQYAATRFGDFARLSGAPRDDPAGQAFAPDVAYTDYAPSVADVLALCLTGFPAFDTTSTNRRSLIYLGPPTYPEDPARRRSLYTDRQVEDMAARAGVQVNAITAAGGDPWLQGITQRTGGRLVDQSDVAVAVQRIRDNPPPVVLPDGTRVTDGTVDAPVVVLAVGLVIAALLTVTLVVLRR